MKSNEQIETSSGDPLSKKVVQGGVWIFSLRIFNRGLGFIRTIILARLLAPEDFGLLGIAMLSISTLETFSQTGFQTALIQKKENIESYLDTAWTVSAIRGLILFLLLFLTAPLIGDFFNSSQAIIIIRVIAVSTLLSGLRNIGILYFQKELDFRKQFFYEFSATLVDLSISITLAFLLRNVWALVLGGLAANTIRLLASYIIHSYRPSIKLDNEKIQELFGFGKWVFLSSILIFLLTHGDDIFVGKVLGITALGLYQMAYTLSNLPATEITHLISQITFPAYSKLQSDIPKLGTAFLKVIRLSTLLSFFFAAGIFILSPDFIKLFLGNKWVNMIPVVQILCIFGITRSLGATMGPILFSTGNPKIQVILSSIQFLILAIIIYPFTLNWGISGTAIAVVIPNTIALILITKRVIKLLTIGYKDILNSIGGPFIASFSMALIIFLIKLFFISSMNVWSFFIILILCFTSYFFIIFQMDRKNNSIRNNIKEVAFNLGLVK